MVLNPAPNVLAFAAGFFRCGPDETLFEAVRAADAQRLDDFLCAYREWAAGGRLRAPVLQPGELRPYLATNDPMTSGMLGSLRLNPGAFADDDRVWAATDALKHRLLYCHSIAIDDPLGEILYMGRPERLLHYIHFLIHMRPLIENGALCLVAPAVYQRGFAAHKSSFSALCDSITSGELPDIDTADFAPILSAEESALWRAQASDPIFRRDVAEEQLRRLSRGFDLLAEAPKRVGLYLPFRYDLDLLDAVLRQIEPGSSEVVQAGAVRRDHAVLSRLVDLELPGLESLPPKEMVALREADAFHLWRSDLREALRAAYQPMGHVVPSRQEVRAEIIEKLRPAKEKLEDAFQHSSVLMRLRGMSMEFMAGGAGSLAGALITGDPVTTAVSAALGAGLGATLAKAFKPREEAEAGKQQSGGAATALWAHYVAVVR